MQEKLLEAAEAYSPQRGSCEVFQLFTRAQISDLAFVVEGKLLQQAIFGTSGGPQHHLHLQ